MTPLLEELTQYSLHLFEKHNSCWGSDDGSLTDDYSMQFPILPAGNRCVGGAKVPTFGKEDFKFTTRGALAGRSFGKW